MARDGGGVYSKPAGTTAVSGTTIESAKFNQVIDDLVTDANTDRPIVAGGTGASSASVARDNLEIDSKVQDKATAYTAVAGDRSTVIRCTATLTLSLTAAATLADGWFIVVKADGGTVTIDPDGAETIDDAATLTLNDGGSVAVFCNGTTFYSAFLGNLVGDTTPQLGGMLDVNGQAIGDGTLELLKFTETASAVNEFTIANAATTNGPTLSATGDDTNIDLNFTAKGTGSHVFTGDIKGDGSAYLTEQASAGADTAGDGQHWVKNLAPNEAYFTDDAGTDWLLQSKALIVREEQTSGTSGGTFTSGSWQTRTLNTTQHNSITGASLSSNQITLPAGTYDIFAAAPAYNVSGHQAKLYNITDTADEIIGKVTVTNQSTDNSSVESIVSGRFTIAAQKTFEIQHQCQATQATNGFGLALSFTTEVYTTVEIRKVG